MIRLAAIVLCLAAAACARQGPPAPVVACRTGVEAVVIVGAPQRALSTYCRDEQGHIVLRR
jgi:hypothetical protein